MGYGVTVTIDPQGTGVTSSQSKSLTLDGSFTVPGTKVFSLGTDVSFDLKSGNPSFTLNAGITVGTPGEGHALYTETSTNQIKDPITQFFDNLSSFIDSKIAEMYEDQYEYEMSKN